MTKMQIAVLTAILTFAVPLDAGAEAAAGAKTTSGWQTFVDRLRDLPARMLNKLPEAQRNDPQIRAEVERVALAALASATIDALGSDPDHPAFVPQVNHVLNVAQPNADTTYRIARIAPGGTYRLRGNRGSLRMARIAEASLLPGNSAVVAGASIPKPVHDITTLHADERGTFDVILSPQRPQGYTGDWWPLAKDTDSLLLRLVSADWGREAEPTISIERLDIPSPRTRISAAALEKRVGGLMDVADFIGTFYLDKVEQLRAAGYVNKLRKMNTSALGLPDQIYYEGAYELKDNEALIVEAKHPAHCAYRSIILTNEVYETTDWYNNHSSLNDAQAAADSDGVLRFVISARDPGVRNWLDTAGYPSGSIQGRWAGCDSQPVPSIRKVAFADIGAALPPQTVKVAPADRENIIRQRRAALQQRPLW
jgi:hypothetical protein